MLECPTYVSKTLRRNKFVTLAKKLKLTDIAVKQQEWTGNRSNIIFTFKHNGFSGRMNVPIAQFLGCCGIDIIHEADLDYQFHGLGIGDFFIQVIVEAYMFQAYEDQGPGLLLAATNNEQGSAEALMTRQHWRKHRAFVNPNSGNVVTWWSKSVVPTAAFCKCIEREC